MANKATVGDFEVTLVRAGVYRWDGGALFGVVPKSLWSRHIAADDLNRIPLGFNCYLIETGAHTVLVETGGGDKLHSGAWHRMGLPGPMPPMPEILASQGIDPERIDIVVNSHLHFDHCSGNTWLRNGEPVVAFPRAKYFARRGEWEYAHERNARDAVSYCNSNYDPLVESGQMTLTDGDCEVVPGVWLERAAGHNRDMCIVRAVSKGKTFCFWSDLIPTKAHLKPTWVAAFDLFPLETIASKTRLIERASREGWVCGYGHDADLSFDQA